MRRRWVLIVVVMLNVLLYAVYFLHLKADFPNSSPWNDFAKFTDEGWYGGTALRWLQTGRWYVEGGFNPTVVLPAWPVVLAGWFRLVGPGMVAARALTVLFFGGSLVLLYALLRPWTGRLAAALSVTLVVVNPYCFGFDRLALLEPLVVFLFLLALWVASGHGGVWARAIAVGALLAAAVLTKTTAVVLAPAVLYQLWATAAGPLPPVEAWDLSRWHRVVRHVLGHGRALALLVVAAVTGGVLWGLYFLALVRPHHLAAYQQLFAVNAGKAHGRILLQVMARALGDTLWINRILLPLTMLAVAASTRFLRELWRVPLYVSSVLALAGTIGMIGWHTWFQPRYYVVCVFPAVMVLAVATRALRERARGLERGSPWRMAHRVTMVALEVAGATMLLQTVRYVLHPEYTMRDAADGIAATMRADASHAPVLLSGSGDTIALFTGVRAVNPEWALGGLPALLEREQPGWFAAFTPREEERIADLRTRYDLRPVAEYRVFDEPEHRVLQLYRLEPPGGGSFSSDRAARE